MAHEKEARKQLQVTPTHVGMKSSNLTTSMDAEPTQPRGLAHKSNKRNHMRNGGQRRKFIKGQASPKVMTEKDLTNSKFKES